jgi:phosphoglycerate dehydrogenase-like enzyme
MGTGYVRSMQPVVHVAPDSDRAIEEAITTAGGRIGPLAEAEALVWLGSNPNAFPELPDQVRWVQLPWAGVENWLDKLDDKRVWTSATIAFGKPVAEHALALMLAGVRRIADCAREQTWTAPPVRPFAGSTVAVVGTGAIGGALIDLVGPFDVEVIAVTRRGRDGTLPIDRLPEALPRADFVVIAAPATSATRHLIGAAELAAMRDDAWLVNVSRGTLVDTDALVAALQDGAIGGAALDVTEPEPLPAGHPLWTAPGLLLTPHVGGEVPQTGQRVAATVVDQVRRILAGEPLVNVVDEY